MKSAIISFSAFLLAVPAFAAEPTIVPAPQTMELREGAFKLAPDTRIYTDAASAQTGKDLAARLHTATGYSLSASVKQGSEAGILLTTEGANAALGAEGYELTVEPKHVVIRAPQQSGL